MRPAFTSSTNRRGVTALPATLRTFFLATSDMWHPYGDLTRNWSALIATVPRTVTTILDKTIVAGMIVLLIAVMRRSFLAAHLHIPHAIFFGVGSMRVADPSPALAFHNRSICERHFYAN